MTRRRALLMTAALAAAGCGPAAGGPAARVAEVKQQDLVVDVEVTGSLKAVDSDGIGPPAVTDVWDYKIARLAPEGAKVKAGEEVVAFDPSELEKRLRDYESEVAKLSEELGKMRAESSLAAINDRLKVEEAEAARRKAELKADKPPDLSADLSVKTSAVDLDLAKREAEWRRREDRAHRRGEKADQAMLERRLERARRRVEEIKEDVDRMSVKARRAGTVVYKQDWRGEKMKVGDATWRGQTVAQVAALDKMEADGQVDEVDASKVRKGQRVALRLEAHPDVEHMGVVDRIANLVGTESPESRVKVAALEIRIEKTDPLVMRPGMRFRGRIEVDRIPGVLQVPLTAIRSTARGPLVTRAGKGAGETVAVKLGRRSREAVEVLAGLAPGDRVALEAPPGAGGGKETALRPGGL